MQDQSRLKMQDQARLKMQDQARLKMKDQARSAFGGSGRGSHVIHFHMLVSVRSKTIE